jgi:CRP-like cAMP-binding protein
MTPAELREIPLLEGASDAGLERVAAAAGEMTSEPGQLLALEGDPGSGMFLILDGTVSVEWRGGSVELGPGDFFGELTLLAPGGTRIARVRASSRVRCVAIPMTTRSRSSSRADSCVAMLRSLADSQARCLTLAPRAGKQPSPPLTGVAGTSGTKLIAENRARGATTSCSSVSKPGSCSRARVKSARDGKVRSDRHTRMSASAGLARRRRSRSTCRAADSATCRIATEAPPPSRRDRLPVREGARERTDARSDAYVFQDGRVKVEPRSLVDVSVPTSVASSRNATRNGRSSGAEARR